MEVVDINVHVAGQQVAGPQRNDAHGNIGVREGLGHHPHGPIAAAHQDEIGLVLQS